MTISASFPTTRNSLNLNFAKLKRLDPRITFTRASDATYVDENGIMQTATTDAPRFTHDPVTGKSLGLLVEESKTNLLLWSEEFDSASWTPGTAIASVTANAGTAPNGTETADLVSGVSTEADQRYQTVSLSPDVSYCFSVYVKPTTSSLIRIGIFSAPSTWIGGVDILWSSGVPSTNATVGSPTDISYTDAGNGWYRCSIVVAIASAGSYQAHFHPDRNNAQKAALVWGGQLEADSFPTSYIPTTGTAATRAEDIATITGTNFSQWYRQDEGTVFVGGKRISYTGNSSPVSINDGSTDNEYSVRQGSDADGFVLCRTSDVLRCSPSLSYSSALASNKTCFSYDANTVSAASLSFLKVVMSLSGTPVVNQMCIGVRNNSGTFIQHFNGTISRLAFWPRRLSDPTLQEITR